MGHGHLMRCATAIAWMLCISSIAPLASFTSNTFAATGSAPVTEAPIAAASWPVARPTSLVSVADGRMLAPDIARIVNRGELVVAMLGVDTPPFFAVRGSELVGLEVDLARSIARELKVPVRFDRSAKTFNDVVDIVAKGDADLGISKLSRTLARAQRINFSEPYLRLNHALILNRVRFAEYAGARPLPTVIRSYTGTLGVIEKSSYQDYAQRNFPNAKLRLYPNWADLLQAVQKGEVAAAYRDEFEVKRVLKADPTFSLTMRTVSFKDLEDSLGIAIGVQDQNLLRFINQFLTMSKQQLTVEKVLNALDN
jgi:ABC-type amino acid transport substrate-binding protein